MIKKIIFAIFALFIVISPSIILADNNNTIVYLQDQTQNSWITQALAAAEVVDIDTSYIDADTDDLMTAIKNILALAAIQNIEGHSFENLLNVINNNINNGQIGSEDRLNDDFWGVMALASINQANDIDSIKNFILSHQNSDGGWSWSVSGASDSNDTVAAIMALLDLGLTSSSNEISQALIYLQSTQNNDGGFAYNVDSESDGGSTAWAISALNKLDIEASSWQKGNNNPISFLESLRQDDGSFLWMHSDDDISTMVTAYALVALSGKAYPVNYIELEENQPEETGHDLRIEGPDSTICLASNLEANTVLALLEAGSQVCNFEYVTEDSDYGIYVSSIAGMDAKGEDGWQYFVDFHSGMVSVADYQLTNNEQVLWGYGSWPLYPSKIETNNLRLAVSEDLILEAKYYNGTNWQPWENASVYIGGDVYQTNSSGQLTITMPYDGVYPVWAEYDDERIRSNKFYVTVGSGISQTVDLTVNIESEDGEPNQQDLIAFSVDQSSIDFGNLKAGQLSETILNLSNDGNVDIYIEASVVGEDLFQNHTSLNQVLWPDYNLNLPSANTESVNISLSIPSDFSALGQKNGQLIFWAINQ